MRMPTAAIKALGEALWLQLLPRLRRPGEWYRPYCGCPASPHLALASRPEIHEIYRLDDADIMDCGYHVQLHLDPESQVRFECQLADPVVREVEFDSLTTHTDTETDMRRAGFEPTWVVSPRLMSCTWTVSLFPGASPIPAGLPFLWSAGLRRRFAGRAARTMPLPH
ncbi:hypothetical protein [Rhodococcus sp. MS16]|uniref:hypothetical protein n=1 Tax=Rhodococcus sp. MS16 TaxID=2579941 RepID=UPI001F5B161D|nr:hypothetical protein [Rhodococcus sp. MS16]